MAPIVPTYRPLVTPTRTAIAIALVAVFCSVFLAVDAAQGRAGADALTAGSIESCAQSAIEAVLTERVSRVDDAAPPTH